MCTPSIYTDTGGQHTDVQFVPAAMRAQHGRTRTRGTRDEQSEVTRETRDVSENSLDPIVKRYAKVCEKDAIDEKDAIGQNVQ